MDANALKFASLGSGSEGNALIISSHHQGVATTVMIDCGFGLRETEKRLARLGLVPADLSGILVTHEHQDHVGGVFKFAKRHAVPVWLSFGTYQAVRKNCDGVDVRFCRDGVGVSIGSLELLPYTVPHDAQEPVQYTASNGRFKLGVLTDAGHKTSHLINALHGCHGLVVECNHDRRMLETSAYPPSLKQRIGGAYGHLSNETIAEIVADLNQSHLQILVGAHLSKKNNTPDLALAALNRALHAPATQVIIACQEQGFDWLVLS